MPYTVINGINTYEIVEGYDESAGAQGLQSTKRYLCSWTDRYTLANSFLGLSSATSIGGVITRTPPMVHPESPNILAKEVSIRGTGTPFQGPKQLAFPYAVVSVSYGTYTWDAIPNQNFQFDPTGTTSFIYATQDLEYSHEQIQFPSQNLQFSDFTPLRGPYYMRSANATLVLTLHRMPWLPANAVEQFVGKINIGTYLNCPAGTLRFDGASTHRTASTDGTKVADCTYRFTYRSIAPWDYGWNPTSKEWQQIQTLAGNPVGPARIDYSSVIPLGYIN